MIVLVNRGPSPARYVFDSFQPAPVGVVPRGVEDVAQDAADFDMVGPAAAVPRSVGTGPS